jgi:hypothetical protein
VRFVAALVVSFVAAALGGASGCAHGGGAGGPEGTLAAFASAVERKDYDAAYALTSVAYRARVTPAVFRATLEAGGADTLAESRALRARVEGPRLRADVALDLGETVPLVREEGGWRLDAQPFEPFGQSTPRAALRAFIHALERRRFDLALRLVPARYRAGLTAETLRGYWEGERRADNAQLLTRLRAAAAQAIIVETGDEAHMPYGDEQEVHFVREGGEWKIEDPD